MARTIVLDRDDGADKVFAEETRATLRDDGSLSISHWYKDLDDGEWYSWQDSGSYLSPSEVEKLRELLNGTDGGRGG